MNAPRPTPGNPGTPARELDPMGNDALAEALRQLEIAAGSMLSPVWEAHAEAIPKAVDGLSQFYLHTTVDGHFSAEPIYLNPAKQVWGLVPAALEPLLDLLERQTERLSVAVAEGRLGDASALTLKRWSQRLSFYRTSLDSLPAYEPSEVLWTNVTAPLLQGLYPQSFATMGIINPAVASKPDVTTVPTELFVVALGDSLVDNVQVWLTDWTESVQAWKEQMVSAIENTLAEVGGAVKEGARVGAWILGAGVVLGGGWLLWRALKKGNQ